MCTMNMALCRRSRHQGHAWCLLPCMAMLCTRCLLPCIAMVCTRCHCQCLCQLQAVCEAAGIFLPETSRDRVGRVSGLDCPMCHGGDKKRACFAVTLFKTDSPVRIDYRCFRPKCNHRGSLTVQVPSPPAHTHPPSSGVCRNQIPDAPSGAAAAASVGCATACTLGLGSPHACAYH